MYSRGTKERRGSDEKKEHVGIIIYLDNKVRNDFQKFIASFGISVSRTMEASMRVTCNSKAAIILEGIYYSILKTISHIKKKENKTSRKK